MGLSVLLEQLCRRLSEGLKLVVIGKDRAVGTLGAQRMILARLCAQVIV